MHMVHNHEVEIIDFSHVNRACTKSAITIQIYIYRSVPVCAVLNYHKKIPKCNVHFSNVMQCVHVHTIGLSPADPVRAEKYGYIVEVLVVCSCSTFSTVRNLVAPIRLHVSAISFSGHFDGWLITNSVELLTFCVFSSLGRSSSGFLFGRGLVVL